MKLRFYTLVSELIHKRRTLSLGVALMMLWPLAGVAQCDPEVPLLVADLSYSVDATYISPAVQRVGNCCGTTDPDNCIQFEITLHPDATGINFEICDGAIPPGALFYQINCGPQVEVGEDICLDGPGPHLLTFCKPGNNNNVYCITSIPPPSAGPDVAASDGCLSEISCSGYDPTTIQWSSVYPGAPGAMDFLLECSTCETTLVNVPNPITEYVDYVVCGVSLGGCSQADPHCDTVRVYFSNTLGVNITPNPPAICAGSAFVEVDAVGTGGYPPYTFTWSNNTTGSTTQFTQAGTYTVQISDSTGCPPASLTFEVVEYDMPLVADAGPDQLVCDLSNGVQLQGSFSGIDECSWTGGGGVFAPSANVPDPIYYPTNAEIQAGTITLTMNLLPVGGCPPEFDSVTFEIAPFSAAITYEVNDVSCAGAGDGSIGVMVNGPYPPYEIYWPNQNLTSPQLFAIGGGSYPVTVTNAFGCSEQLVIEVEEPNPVSSVITSLTSPLCDPEDGGSVVLNVGGGVPPYACEMMNFGYAGSFVLEDLQPGLYNLEIIDANGCTDLLQFEIEDVEALTIEAEDEVIICPGDLAEMEAVVNGGTAPYNYVWSDGLPNSPQQQVPVNEDTDFQVYVADANGCLTEVIDINVYIMGMEPGQLTVSNDEDICAGETATLEAWHWGDYPPYDYEWSNGLPPSLGPHQVNPMTSQNYTVTVTDLCGNELVETIAVNVHPDPIIALPVSDYADCAPVGFLLNDPQNDANGFVHIWQVDNGNTLYGNPAMFIEDDPGVYDISLSVTSPFGCVTTGQNVMTITIHESPEASFDADPWVTTMSDPEVNFVNTTESLIADLDWIIEGTTIPGVNSFNYTFNESGVFPVQLVVSNQWGCADTLVQYVRVDGVYEVEIPNAFTPDEIGGGGYYNPGGLDNTIFYPFAEDVEEFRMMIFNRWGELIFESRELQYGWDGTYRDQPCPQDVYVYKIELKFTDGHEFIATGDITLFR